jgi:hypothetical protein
MKKRAISASVTLLLVVASVQAGAQSPQPTILQCVGDEWGDGINAPKDAFIPPRDSNLSGTYVMQGNAITERGGGKIADRSYPLCNSTVTTYSFSSDCSVHRALYIHDWESAKDFDTKTGPFYKKYPDSWAGVVTIVVDRVNLRVDEEWLDNHVRGDYDQKTKKSTYLAFFTSTRFSGTCELGKPKI